MYEFIIITSIWKIIYLVVMIKMVMIKMIVVCMCFLTFDIKRIKVIIRNIHRIFFIFFNVIGVYELAQV